MTFKTMTPKPEKQHPQTIVQPSPEFSQYGHSPSIPPPAYTTDDLLAAKYRKISNWTLFARTVLAFLTLCISAAVIGCSADSLREYSSSKSQAERMLPLWPMRVDLRPTHAVLACGIIMMVFSLTYLVLAFIPMVSEVLSSWPFLPCFSQRNGGWPAILLTSYDSEINYIDSISPLPPLLSWLFSSPSSPSSSPPLSPPTFRPPPARAR